MVPGYKASFTIGDFETITNTRYRRSSATWLWFNLCNTSESPFRFVYSSNVDTRTRGRTKGFAHTQSSTKLSCDLQAHTVLCYLSISEFISGQDRRLRATALQQPRLLGGYAVS